MKRRICVYPGTFDPITLGHVDLVRRSLTFFDEVIVAVAADSGKTSLFTPDERTGMIKHVFADCRNVHVDSFNGLLVSYLRKKGLRVVIRGLRAVSDFEYELQMALTNRRLSGFADTVFLMPSEEYFYISSSMVKQISALGGSVHEFVPAGVEKMLKVKLNIRNVKGET